MRKSIAVLFAVLCLSLPQVGLTQPQLKLPDYSEVIAQSQQNIKVKNYVNAEKEAQEALALAKNPAQTGDALMAFGETFYGRHRFEEARIQWNKVIALPVTDPEDNFLIRGHMALAQSYLSEGNAEKAISEYTVLLPIFENNPDFKNEPNFKAEGTTVKAVFAALVAGAYLEARQFGIARDQFDQLLEFSKNKLDATSELLVGFGEMDAIETKFKFEKSYKESLVDFSKIANTQGIDSLVKQQAQKKVKVLNLLIQLEKTIQEEQQLNQELRLNIE